MNKAQQKGIFLETCLKESNGFVELTVFQNNKRKAFVENIKQVAKEFHLEVIWKEKDGC